MEAETAWHELERRRGPAIRDYVKANLWKLERHINAEDTVGLVYHLAWFWHRGTMMYPKLPYTSRRLQGFLLCNPNLNVDTYTFDLVTLSTVVSLWSFRVYYEAALAWTNIGLT